MSGGFLFVFFLPPRGPRDHAPARTVAAFALAGRAGTADLELGTTRWGAGPKVAAGLREGIGGQRKPTASGLRRTAEMVTDADSYVT